MEPGISAALSGEVSSTVLDSDDDGRSLAVHFAPYQLPDGTIEGTLVHWQDISAVRNAQRTRDVALERFRVAFENAPIGMALLDLEGRFTQVNTALCEILGYSEPQLLEMRMLSLTHPDDTASDGEAMAEMAAGQRTSYSTEKRYLHASGHALSCALQATVLTDEDGHPRALLSQIQDITERKRNEEQLEYLADHDALTGLRNRRAFARELEAHAGMNERYGPAGTIMMIDLDQFKFVNDTLGHQAGDELIVRVAHLLSERLRSTDVLARLGGDEFAVLLPKAGPSAAKLVASSVLETLRSEALLIAGTEPKITASIGIASFEDGNALIGEEVLINADLAMYDAKEEGRDRIAMFSNDQYTQTRMKGRITWAQRITAGLQTDSFALLAQPIIDLATRRTSQYELLLRMKDDHGDLIPPSTFLYIAERLDLIGDIDTWVVRHGIRMLADLVDRPDVSLEINLSARSLGDAKLLELIDTELRNGSIAPERVIFEVTETAALTSVTKARAFGEHLSEIGCRFALDDFGAGFGSFYCRRQRPRATHDVAHRVLLKQRRLRRNDPVGGRHRAQRGFSRSTRNSALACDAPLSAAPRLTKSPAPYRNASGSSPERLRLADFRSIGEQVKGGSVVLARWRLAVSRRVRVVVKDPHSADAATGGPDSSGTRIGFDRVECQREVIARGAGGKRPAVAGPLHSQDGAGVQLLGDLRKPHRRDHQVPGRRLRDVTQPVRPTGSSSEGDNSSL